MGAAFLAGLAVGFWNGIDDLKENWALGHTFRPVMQPETRKELVRGWSRAVRAAIAWAQDDCEPSDLK